MDVVPVRGISKINRAWSQVGEMGFTGKKSNLPFHQQGSYVSYLELASCQDLLRSQQGIGPSVGPMQAGKH